MVSNGEQHGINKTQGKASQIPIRTLLGIDTRSERENSSLSGGMGHIVQFTGDL